MDKIIVSVCCLTYNQKNYIRECLDGILMQKTNFKFEILINDDCSTDGTSEIIKEYEQKYPDIIKPVYQKENQFSKGISICKNFIFPRVKGKYVAICEGDDYWTDPNKLQKQVDFLEENPDYTVCFHRVKRIYDSLNRKSDILPSYEMLKKADTFDYKNLLKANFIQNCSVMLRWNVIKKPEQRIPNKILTGDWYLALLFAKYGKIKMLDDVMSVYRVNTGGVWFGAYKNQNKFLCKTAIQRMAFYFGVYNKITDKDPVYFINEAFEQYKKVIKVMKSEKECKKYINFILRCSIPVYFTLIQILLKTVLSQNKKFELVLKSLF